MEDKNPAVKAKENIIPLGVLGKSPSILSAMSLCKEVFSTAIASKKPPKNKKIIG